MNPSVLHLPEVARLVTVLHVVLEDAARASANDRAALYVAQLSDPGGFGVALRVHAQVEGPNPVEVRKRARERGIRDPFMSGAAPFETLARILETPAADVMGSTLAAWATRETIACGAVPVVVLHDGRVVVTTLAALEEPTLDTADAVSGWFHPIPVDA